MAVSRPCCKGDERWISEMVKEKQNVVLADIHYGG